MTACTGVGCNDDSQNTVAKTTEAIPLHKLAVNKVNRYKLYVLNRAGRRVLPPTLGQIAPLTKSGQDFLKMLLREFEILKDNVLIR